MVAQAAAPLGAAAPSGGVEIRLESHRGARFTTFALTPAQAAFWADRTPVFVGSAGNKAWEEDPEDFLEENPEVAELWDDEMEAWREDDPRWLTWDSYDDFDEAGAVGDVHVTVNGEKGGNYKDFAATHGCEVRVDERKAAGAAGAATFFGIDEEKGVGWTLGGGLPVGEAFDPSKIVFYVTRVVRPGGDETDYVTGASYPGVEDENGEPSWDCCSGEGGHGFVE